MATTSKLNWLAIAVIFLAAVNLVFLGYIWLERKDETKIFQQPHDARDYLVKQLRLNDVQEKQFDSLRKGHFEQMKTDREEMRRLKDDLFSQLKNGNGSGENGIARQIGEVQSRIDLNTFRHFASLRAICTEEQKKRFDEIIEDVLRNMGRGPGRPDGAPPGVRP
jgi:periplasmic protein CpxP/Spy